MDNLSQSDAALFQRCYTMLQSSLSTTGQRGNTVNVAALGGAKTSNKPRNRKANSKRKREDLQVSTGVEDGSLYLPETPRRTLHTQLLLKLMSNANALIPDLISGKDQPVDKTNLPPPVINASVKTESKASKESAKDSGLEVFAESLFSNIELGNEVQPLEQLDIDFNEV